MSDNESEYLAPGFDPSSLTVARLRNILVSNNVIYPASAKKAQLVDLFNQQIAPTTGRLRAARARVRRTSKGITDMPSSQESTADGEEEEEGGRAPMPPPSAAASSARRSSRRSTREPSESATPQPPTPSTRRKTAKHPRLSDTEEDQELEAVRPSVRRSRKSHATPTVKVEEPEDTPTPKRPEMKGSAFSSDNPFQSGSSPPASGEHRRRSANLSRDRRKSSASRRRTTANVDRPTPVQQDGIVVPSRKTFEVPMSRLQQPEIKREPEENGIEAGEEFTPEEQLDLVRMNAADGETDILPPRRRSRRTQTSSLSYAPMITLLPIVTAILFFYRQEKIATGYCGLSQPSLSPAIFRAELPEYAESLQPVIDMIQPSCEPCPQHATCYEGMEARCDPDFILKPHPLTANGILPIPLPPTCEPDGEKARKVKAVADRGIEELRQHKAAHECGIPSSSTTAVSPRSQKPVASRKPPSTPSVSTEELKIRVSSKKRKSMSDEEFEELWRPAIGEILGREEVTASTDRTHLSTSSLARLPLTCSLRRSIRLTLVRYSGALSFVAFVFFIVLYTRSKISQTLASRARVPDLVATSLDRLATQAALHARNEAPEPWLSVGQLRDDVLREIFNVVEREKLWTRVKAVVERNANVRASVREGRGGDVSRVWEWIGGFAGLEGPSSHGNKRVSFYQGPLRESEDPGNGGGSGQEMVKRPDASSGGGEIRKWNEGRPIY